MHPSNSYQGLCASHACSVCKDLKISIPSFRRTCISLSVHALQASEVLDADFDFPAMPSPPASPGAPALNSVDFPAMPGARRSGDQIRQPAAPAAGQAAQQQRAAEAPRTAVAVDAPRMDRQQRIDAFLARHKQKSHANPSTSVNAATSGLGGLGHKAETGASSGQTAAAAQYKPAQGVARSAVDARSGGTAGAARDRPPETMLSMKGVLRGADLLGFTPEQQAAQKTLRVDAREYVPVSKSVSHASLSSAGGGEDSGAKSGARPNVLLEGLGGGLRGRTLSQGGESSSSSMPQTPSSAPELPSPLSVAAPAFKPPPAPLAGRPLSAPAPGEAPC